MFLLSRMRFINLSIAPPAFYTNQTKTYKTLYHSVYFRTLGTNKKPGSQFNKSFDVCTPDTYACFSFIYRCSIWVSKAVDVIAKLIHVENRNR